ncbi:MAG: hypothetical protein E7548_03805 [Ruminococcaceae bacterium]|nr:hypothetical protein [Oscillospiraceae bacterium]
MYKQVTLEVSLKPFKETSDAYIKSVCRKIFSQWQGLLKDCQTISIMLWAADGSEILDYAGKLDDEFQWACYIGNANLPLNTTGDDSISPHTYKYLYMENPPKMTYGILKKIVATLKAEGKKAFPDKNILVGHTFDIGPEFAISDFKYNRHKEICTGTKLDRLGFVDCTATLNADNRCYAAFKNGIPEGTPIGLFLGKQTSAFLKDMGMDFIWLSNGFGFSADPWSLNGKVFDGEKFYPEKLKETREKVFEFWKFFKAGCPDFPIRTRGTNNTVGIDYATDAVPIYDIYNGDFGIDPPPNSPWAALNDNYGLEIMGHMTRICQLPGDGFLFRYYIHDPWWANSPWYDRYGGQPMDIYLPCAVSRIDENGRVQTADNLSLLTIDNSFGALPDSCVNEPLPHLIKAKKDAGDAPAPLVLIYPFREYSTSLDESLITEMYYGDNYICEAINNSLPLNCVTSTDNFLLQDLSVYSASVLISPVPENPKLKEKLKVYCENGGKVIFYGSKERLTEISDIKAQFVDFKDSPTKIRQCLKKFGIEIDFKIYDETKKTTTMTIAKNDNSLVFSTYNETTALDTYLKFPLGAPIFTGRSAIIENGKARYNFSVSEHLECRAFVQQESGVVTLKEKHPCSKKFRRRLQITGLKDATVCFFAEDYCKQDLFVGREEAMDFDPVEFRGFKIIQDEHGTYYKGEHISGNITFSMPFKEYLK